MSIFGLQLIKSWLLPQILCLPRYEPLPDKPEAAPEISTTKEHGVLHWFRNLWVSYGIINERLVIVHGYSELLRANGATKMGLHVAYISTKFQIRLVQVLLSTLSCIYP